VYELLAISAGSATSALLLAAEHVLLWGQKDQMSLTGRYRLGTVTLALGECVALLLLALWGVLGAASVVAAVGAPILIGGATIEGLHYWRRSRGQSPWPETLFEAGVAAGVAKERQRNGTARES
jgi:hypothetical protein